jgi:hypothetical protein
MVKESGAISFSHLKESVGLASSLPYNPQHVFSVSWPPANVGYRCFLRGRYWPSCRNCLRVSMALQSNTTLKRHVAPINPQTRSLSP